MEKPVKKITYLFIEEEQRSKVRIRSHPQIYPYAAGGGTAYGRRRDCGLVELSFDMLPEGFRRGIRKKHNRKWVRLFTRTVNGLGNDPAEIVYSEELQKLLGREQEIPQELFAVLLYRDCQRKRGCRAEILIPQEAGVLFADTVIEIMEPYLAGLRSVALKGGAEEAAKRLEEVFFRSYGIVCERISPEQAGKIGRPLEAVSGEKVLTLDLTDYGRIWNFLDTAVKTGYNTLVN